MISEEQLQAKMSGEGFEMDEKMLPKSPASMKDDGSKFAWFQALGAFFLMFNSWGLVNSFGAFQTYYQTDLLRSTSASEISWIGSIQTFLLIFGGLATGPLFDKGYLRSLLCAGSFLIVFGLMVTSICHRYWQVVLSQGLVVGLGCACFFVPSVAIIPQYHEKRRALALGVTAAGGSLGGIIYTILFERLLVLVGFGWATRVVAFFSLGTLLIPALGMKWRGDPKKQPMKFEARAWKDVPYSLFAGSAFFGFIGIYIPFFYIQLYSLSQRSITGDLNAYLLPILNAGSLVGRLLPPYLADTLGPLNVISFCTFGSLVLAFAWIGISSAAGIVVFCLLFGFFSGAFVALGPAVIASLTPDMSLFGVRLGMLFVPASVGVLIGNPIAGALSDHGWVALQAFCGAILFASSLCMTVARVYSVGIGLKVKI